MQPRTAGENGADAIKEDRIMTGRSRNCRAGNSGSLWLPIFYIISCISLMSRKIGGIRVNMLLVLVTHPSATSLSGGTAWHRWIYAMVCPWF